MEETKVQEVDINDLVQDKRNFNKGNEQGQELMERSFKEMGAGRSILIDRNGHIIAGNKSQKAAIAAGIKKVRVIETTGDELVAVKRTDVDIDSAEGRKLAYLDNLTTQVNLTWDETELEAVQADVEGFDIADFGFDIEDLPQVTFPTGEKQGEGEGKPQTEVKEDDFDPDAHYETKVKAGEVWQLGEHRLMCGDSTDADAVAKLMNGERADLVFTDPPYGMKYTRHIPKDEQRFDMLKNDDTILDFFPCVQQFSDGFVFVCTTFKVLNQWLPLFCKYLDLSNMIIWYKGGGGLGDLRTTFAVDYEVILVSSRKHEIFGKRIGSVWECGRDNGSDYDHPTQKPVALSGMAIDHTTKDGDIVLDLFGGSGSTMIACEQLGRKCRMMELDPHYCTVIIARWEKLTGQKAIKLNP